MTQGRHSDRRVAVGNPVARSCASAVGPRLAEPLGSEPAGTARPRSARSGNRRRPARPARPPRRHAGIASGRAIPAAMSPSIGCALSPARTFPNRYPKRRERPTRRARTTTVPPSSRRPAPFRRISGPSAVRLVTVPISLVRSPALPSHDRTTTTNRCPRHPPSIDSRDPHRPPRRISHWSPPDASVRPWQANMPSRPSGPSTALESAQVRASASSPSPSPACTASGHQSPSGGINHRARLTADDNRHPESPLRRHERTIDPQRYPQPAFLQQARRACHYTRQIQLSTARGGPTPRHFPRFASHLPQNLTFPPKPVKPSRKRKAPTYGAPQPEASRKTSPLAFPLGQPSRFPFSRKRSPYPERRIKHQ